MNTIIRRVFAWIEDKILVLFIYLIYYFINNNFFAAPGKLGYMVGSLTINSPEIGLRYRDNIDNIQAYYNINLYSMYLEVLKAIIIFVIINRLYYFVCETILNTTVGKKTFNLLYIRNNGMQLRFIDKFVKTIAYWFCYFTVFFILTIILKDQIWYLIVLITNLIIIFPIFITNDNQTLYDLISSTKVITQKKKNENLIEKNATTINKIEVLSTKNNENIFQSIFKAIPIKKNQKLQSEKILISVMLAFLAFNNIIRYYSYYYSYEFNILNNLFISILTYSLILILVYFFIAIIYKQISKEIFKYFPYNVGINRLLFTFMIILSIYSELKYLIVSSMKIDPSDWLNFFLFKYAQSNFEQRIEVSNPKYYNNIYDNPNIFFSGIFLLLLLIMLYIISVWIYRGFKNESVKE